MYRLLYAVLLTVNLMEIVSAEPLIDIAEKDGVYSSEADDPDMNEAYSLAKAGLDAFLSKWKNPQSGMSSFSVKVAVTDGEYSEFFWIIPFNESEQGFTGTINNEPRFVTTVKFGEVLSFTKSQIVDWLYIENGRMMGNYTACAVLKKEPEKQQRQFKEAYGLECSNPQS